MFGMPCPPVKGPLESSNIGNIELPDYLHSVGSPIPRHQVKPVSLEQSMHLDDCVQTTREDAALHRN